jgi:hypothetical protein
MKKLLVITSSDNGVSRNLFENLTDELFELYLTADNSYIDDDNQGCRRLDCDLENAINITNPVDDRLKNLDGVISVYFYY